MNGPKGNSEFCFPEALNVSRGLLSMNELSKLSLEISAFHLKRPRLLDHALQPRMKMRSHFAPRFKETPHY